MSSIVSTVLVVAAAAFVAFGSYARRVELHGVVLPSTGLVHVTSPVAGWVEALNVRDGDSIASGTPLYTLNTDTATRNGNTQQQILRSLAAQRSILLLQIDRKTQIKDQQEAELHQKIENLVAQIQQMNVQIDVKAEFVRTLAKDFEDFTRFVAQWYRQPQRENGPTAELDALQGRSGGAEEPRTAAAERTDRAASPIGHAASTE